MSRISQCFGALHAASRTALIPYVTAGDPSPAKTTDILAALAEGGADIIELGMPFSDPMADGPTIQLAMERALAAGATLDTTLRALSDFRANHDTPVVLFGYVNPLFQRGFEAISDDLASAGGDAVLVVDLPPEAAHELTDHLRPRELDFIGLFTPTSNDARVATIAASATGFAYYVSTAGTTGDAIAALDQVSERVERVRSISQLPVAVGFGIRTPDDVARVATFADGVVVGTALIEAMKQSSDPATAAHDFVASLSSALR